MVRLSLHPALMVDLNFITKQATNLLMTLDEFASPNDIIEGFEDALDAYEEFVTASRYAIGKQRVPEA